MEKKRISDERLAELIRAAALRREVPVGLETRVMAQVILRDRRRRERRAIAAMACYCAVAVAAGMVVGFSPEKHMSLPLKQPFGGRLPAVGRFAGGGVAGLGDSGGSRCGDDGRLRRPGDGNSAQAVTFCD